MSGIQGVRTAWHGGSATLLPPGRRNGHMKDGLNTLDADCVRHIGPGECRLCPLFRPERGRDEVAPEARAHGSSIVRRVGCLKKQPHQGPESTATSSVGRVHNAPQEERQSLLHNRKRILSPGTTQEDPIQSHQEVARQKSLTLGQLWTQRRASSSEVVPHSAAWPTRG